MRKTAKFILVLAVALVLMLCFRAVAFTICTVDGEALAPMFCKGDRLLVNRWSYGLRVGSDDGLIGYTRIGRQTVSRGDIVAFENPGNDDEVLIAQCQALPGDTVQWKGRKMVVPGTVNCAGRDHYWMVAIGNDTTIDSNTLGFISEELLIGRVTTIVYSHDPDEPFWKGWRHERTMQSL